MRSSLFLVLVFLTLGFATATSAQKVRLRSQITPSCEGTPGSRFADIYGDGNIAVQGSYACRGAFIYDLTNPDAPILASHYNPGNSQQFLEAIIIGNRGYFGSGNGGGVHIVDLSDPYAPVLLGVVDPDHGNGFNMIHEMVVFDQNGMRFLVANYNNFSTKALRVINVTNPAQPLFVRDLVPTEGVWVHGIHVRGNRLYTSGWGGRAFRALTEIYDISEVTSRVPTLLGAIQDPSEDINAGNNLHSTWTSEDGKFIYSARETTNGTGDIRVYDISDPSHPLLVNRLSMEDLDLNAVTPHNPVVMGNYLYVSWYQAGVQVFDISSPANPVRIGQYDNYSQAFAPSPDDKKKKSLMETDAWDQVCGSAALQNVLPTTFSGMWAVFPFLGHDKVLAGDLGGGLLVLDATGASRPAKNPVSDFDGDKRTDISVFNSTSGVWRTEPSGGNDLDQRAWGVAGDKPLAGDYDGDGSSDLAVWRPSNGTWYIWQSSGGFRIQWFGQEGDIPVPADYDADGRTDLAVWRPSDGNWYIAQSTLGYLIKTWGISGDKPLASDFEGDGKADLIIWRPSNSTWYVLFSSSSAINTFHWGQEGDRPLVADFDGDGRTELTVFRGSTGFWYALNVAAGTYMTRHFGVEGDIPVPADYDGDSKADWAVFRPDSNTWYRVNSSDGGFITKHFGAENDYPSPASLQPD